MATQTTTNTAATATYLNKTYYDRNLLNWAKAQLVYAAFGQKRGIPKNNGKSVEFRKWGLFTPDANLHIPIPVYAAASGNVSKHLIQIGTSSIPLILLI